MVGLPATGKTTVARRLEVEHAALRLTKDEWMKALYGDENPSSGSDVIEGRLVEIGLRALELGASVVVDFGLWGRDERSALRQAAADRGARVEMHYLRCPATRSGDASTSAARRAPHHVGDSDEVFDGWAAVMQVPTPSRDRRERAGTAAGYDILGRVARTSLASDWMTRTA